MLIQYTSRQEAIDDNRVHIQASNEKARVLSEQHIASNEKRLYDMYNNQLAFYKGIQKDIADQKEHNGHQADIIDNIEDQVLRNKNTLAMHIGKQYTSHLIDINHATVNPVLYRWDLSLDGTGIETLTLLPYGSYIFKYMKDGKIVETTQTNEDLKIFEVNGKLAYTVLKQPLGVLMIMKGM